jgi:hypothetical protein
MHHTDEQQKADWNEAIAKVDPWHAEQMRNRQDDDYIRSLTVIMEHQPKRSAWAKLRSIFSQR